MSSYVATFHSHFGALSYWKALKGRGISATLKPVPRKVSSSCGTCVLYQHSSAIDLDGCELDSIYLEIDDALECVLQK